MLRWLLLLPLGLIMLIFASCELQKAYWDSKVNDLCKADGGLRVYERAVAPPQYKDSDGYVPIPPKRSGSIPLAWEAKPEDPLYSDTEVNDIKKGNLSVKRFRSIVVRAEDKKLPGESISYSRTGGDFPSFAHPSYFRCPAQSGSQELINAVFDVPQRPGDR